MHPLLPVRLPVSGHGLSGATAAAAAGAATVAAVLNCNRGLASLKFSGSKLAEATGCAVQPCTQQ
jgi:hypothetical protein